MLFLPPIWASLMAGWVKNLPAMQETQEMQVWCPSHQDPLEKEMATHSNILAWRIPWTEEPGESHGQRSLVGYSPWGNKKSDMTEQLSIHACMHYLLLAQNFDVPCFLSCPLRCQASWITFLSNSPCFIYFGVQGFITVCMAISITL